MIKITLQKDGSCYPSTRKILQFNSFKDIQKEAIHLLDLVGWDDKQQVDLRNKISCIDYIVYKQGQYHIDGIEIVKE